MRGEYGSESEITENLRDKMIGSLYSELADLNDLLEQIEYLRINIPSRLVERDSLLHDIVAKLEQSNFFPEEQYFMWLYEIKTQQQIYRKILNAQKN